jgi:hypothetical protein
MDRTVYMASVVGWQAKDKRDSISFSLIDVILYFQEWLSKSSNNSVRNEYISIPSTEPNIPRI